MDKVTPFLWFDNNAEEAINFYVSLFKNSRVLEMNRSNEQVTVARLEIDGRPFMALNGGPMFPFTEAISMFIDCEDQAEVDELWAKLSEGGQEMQCGWLRDRFGLSWQVVPRELSTLLMDPDRAKADRVMQAMLKMTKMDVVKLREAYAAE